MTSDLLPPEIDDAHSKNNRKEGTHNSGGSVIRSNGGVL